MTAFLCAPIEKPVRKVPGGDANANPEQADLGNARKAQLCPSAGSPCFSFSFTRFVRIATHLSGAATIERLSLILVLWHCALRRCNNASCFYTVKLCCVDSPSFLTPQKRVNLKGRWSRPLLGPLQPCVP